MITDFVQWLRGEKYKVAPATVASKNNIGLEEALQKSEKDREQIEELLMLRKTGNLLADTWGGRLDGPN